MDSSVLAQAYQEINQRFLQLVDNLSALHGLSALSLNAPDETELLRSALRVLMEHHDLRRCSVFLLEGDTLTCAAGLDWRELLSAGTSTTASRPGTRFRLGEGLIGLAAEYGQLLRSDDCARESRFAPRVGASGTEAVGSLICAPIKAGDDVLGVVNVSHPESGFFSVSHERLLGVFVNFLGQMLSNWRYFHEMERQIQRRTGELEAALAEAEALRHRYQELSVVDELTGLHNRRFFFPEASTALANALRQQRPFSILMLDLDHFKQINDTHGHSMGDDVLQETAALLKRQIREGDVIARFGGEEFVLALPNTDRSGALQLAGRVLDSIRACEFGTFPHRFRVTGTIGVAHSSGTEEDGRNRAELLELLLRHADQALYMGKERGRNQVCAFSDIAPDMP